MNYPVIVEPDGTTFLVRFPDIPEALTCGDTYEDALREAKGALITAFEFYFEDQRPIPMPSADKNLPTVAVPASIWAKVLLLNAMLAQKVTQAELAKRIGTRKQEMQRIVDLRHHTKIDTLSAALHALGKRLNLSLS